jgi:hypothetical protein
MVTIPQACAGALRAHQAGNLQPGPGDWPRLFEGIAGELKKLLRK